MDEAIQVLYVDDDPDLAELVAEFLEREDDCFDVITETSATEGLDRLAANQIDCIVSDYQMPGMDGLEFLATVRESEPDLPFILFTGQGSEKVASNALSTGATDYLQKAGGTEQYELLANRIKNGVESYRAQERASYLERVRTIVRDVNQALVRASSRQEIETQVCEILTDAKGVQLAAFSAVDPETNQIEPQTWAGAEEGDRYLDAVDLTVAEIADGQRIPHERAVSEREIAISRNIQEDPAFDPWRDAVRESGFHTLAVVPIEHKTDLNGLLAVYSGRSQPVGEVARDLLAELADDTAHAINAIETRRELTASEARYRTLAETASDAILTIDATSTITYANPAVEKLFGYSPTELQGTSLTELMPERFHDQHRNGVARYLRTKERQLDWTSVELSGQHKDGTEIPLSISFGEFEQDDEQYFTGIIRDVTERTEQKAELRRQNKHLDDFAGIIAHDLRNPLNTATGRLALAQEESRSEHIEVAAQALDRIDRLIEDLLTLARQGQTVDDLDSVSLANVVEAARQALDSEAVTVEIESPLGTFVGHQGRVLTLVENLFRNAVEHGGEDVLVRVETLADGFAIEDDGPGVPEADRDEVFTSGYTTKDEGTGFGLSIVKKIVDAHGWDITVTDGADGGARFEITGVETDP